MSVAGNQQRTLLNLLAQLSPHWRRDRSLPARVQTLLSRNRSFGSRDRRLYRELIYTTLRFLPWVEPLLESDSDQAARIVAWLAADSPATEHFRKTLVADWPSCPPGVAEKAAVLNQQTSVTFFPGSNRSGAKFETDRLLPTWIAEQCPEALISPEIDALHSRAPLWIRLNTAAIDQVTNEFDQLGWRWRASSILKTALQLLDEVDVTKTAAFAAGAVEVQDLGSQLLLESAGIEPGERWLDACAGAGGKTLQLAQILGATGRIDAFDIRRAALMELQTRTNRAHINTVSILENRPTGEYDGVLVDAPCSGSGTWRRAPHLKWATTFERITEAASIQCALIEEFSRRVRVGGRLLYATCSLNRLENEAVVADFLSTHPQFVSEHSLKDFGGIVRGGGLTVLPALHNTDGFFIAALRREA